MPAARQAFVFEIDGVRMNTMPALAEVGVPMDRKPLGHQRA